MSMRAENLAKALVRVGDDTKFPVKDRRTRPGPLPLGLKQGDEIRTDDNQVVTVIGHGIGEGNIEVAWDDETSGLPATSSYLAHRVVERL